MPEYTIMLGLDVNIRSMEEDELLVKWVDLSIIRAYPAVDVITSGSFPIFSLVSKEYHFEHFPLKSPPIIKTVRLRLLMLFIRMSRESPKDWNCSRFWLGDLYKHVWKHRSFFTDQMYHLFELWANVLYRINIIYLFWCYWDDMLSSLNSRKCLTYCHQ